MPRLRHIPTLFAAACLALDMALPKARPAILSTNRIQPSVAAGESSSSQPILTGVEYGEAALPAAPAAGSPSRRRPIRRRHKAWRRRHASTPHLRGGGGFNGPVGNSSSDITWGGQFGLGAGYQLTNHVAVMLDYQYIDDKLPVL